MIDRINEYRLVPTIRIFPNVPHKDYLSLLRFVYVIVGNSSSGLIEAPSFGLPAVNIGTRQNGRERGPNVIDAPYQKKIIRQCIDKAVHDKKFRDSLTSKLNPYGDGNASGRIAEILATVEINDRLFAKQ